MAQLQGRRGGRERILVEPGTDQADGLRRMFGGMRTRVVELVSGIGGVGRTAVAVNLAAALARAGRSTLLVDFVADVSASRVQRYLGVIPSVDRVPASVAKGYRVIALTHGEWLQSGPLPAGAFVEDAVADDSPLRTRRSLLHAGRGARGEGERVMSLEALDSSSSALYDWVLVNGAGVEPVVASDDGSREVLLVLSNDPRSITEAYALVKRMTTGEGRCRYRVLVNRVHSAASAQRIFRNMADVAGGYLGIELAPIGFIPADPAIERAALAGISVFEHAPVSVAARAFAKLADAIGKPVDGRPFHIDRTLNSAIAAGAM